MDFGSASLSSSPPSSSRSPPSSSPSPSPFTKLNVEQYQQQLKRFPRTTSLPSTTNKSETKRTTEEEAKRGTIFHFFSSCSSSSSSSSTRAHDNKKQSQAVPESKEEEVILVEPRATHTKPTRSLSSSSSSLSLLLPLTNPSSQPTKQIRLDPNSVKSNNKPRLHSSIPSATTSKRNPSSTTTTNLRTELEALTATNANITILSHSRCSSEETSPAPPAIKRTVSGTIQTVCSTNSSRSKSQISIEENRAGDVDLSTKRKRKRLRNHQQHQQTLQAQSLQLSTPHDSLDLIAPSHKHHDGTQVHSSSTAQSSTNTTHEDSSIIWEEKEAADNSSPSFLPIDPYRPLYRAPFTSLLHLSSSLFPSHRAYLLRSLTTHYSHSLYSYLSLHPYYFPTVSAPSSSLLPSSHKAYLTCIRFDQYGSLVCAGSSNGRLHVYDMDVAVSREQETKRKNREIWEAREELKRFREVVVQAGGEDALRAAGAYIPDYISEQAIIDVDIAMDSRLDTLRWSPWNDNHLITASSRSHKVLLYDLERADAGPIRTLVGNVGTTNATNLMGLGSSGSWIGDFQFLADQRQYCVYANRSGDVNFIDIREKNNGSAGLSAGTGSGFKNIVQSRGNSSNLDRAVSICVSADAYDVTIFRESGKMEWWDTRFRPTHHTTRSIHDYFLAETSSFSSSSSSSSYSPRSLIGLSSPHITLSHAIQHSSHPSRYLFQLTNGCTAWFDIITKQTAVLIDRHSNATSTAAHSAALSVIRRERNNIAFALNDVVVYTGYDEQVHCSAVPFREEDVNKLQLNSEEREKMWKRWRKREKKQTERWRVEEEKERKKQEQEEKKEEEEEEREEMNEDEVEYEDVGDLKLHAAQLAAITKSSDSLPAPAESDSTCLGPSNNDVVEDQDDDFDDADIVGDNEFDSDSNANSCWLSSVDLNCGAICLDTHPTQHLIVCGTTQNRIKVIGCDTLPPPDTEEEDQAEPYPDPSLVK